MLDFRRQQGATQQHNIGLSESAVLQIH